MPDVGVSRPASTRSTVDLPAPFVPRRPRISPSPTPKRHAEQHRHRAVGEVDVVELEQRRGRRCSGQAVPPVLPRSKLNDAPFICNAVRSGGAVELPTADPAARSPGQRGWRGDARAAARRGRRHVCRDRVRRGHDGRDRPAGRGDPGGDLQLLRQPRGPALRRRAPRPRARDRGGARRARGPTPPSSSPRPTCDPIWRRPGGSWPSCTWPATATRRLAALLAEWHDAWAEALRACCPPATGRPTPR